MQEIYISFKHKKNSKLQENPTKDVYLSCAFGLENIEQDVFCIFSSSDMVYIF